MCDKKCGLIPFKCKCGGEVCSEHRYTFMHCCDLDYPSIERERSSKSCERQGKQPYSALIVGLISHIK